MDTTTKLSTRISSTGPSEAVDPTERRDQTTAALDLWLETVDDIDIGRLSGDECLGFVGDLLAAQSMAYGRMLKFIAAADKADAAATHGHRSLARLLSERTRMTSWESSRALRDARVLDRHGTTMDALCRGRISRTQASAIVDGIKAGAAAPGGSLRTEKAMLELASRADAAVLRCEVRKLRRAFAPQPPPDGRARGNRTSECQFTHEANGMWTLTAHLEPEAGAIVGNTFNALAADVERARESRGEATDTECRQPVLSALTAMDRANLLVQAFASALEALNSSGTAEARPQLLALVPDRELRERGREQLRTSFGDVLPAPVIERLACDAEVALVAVDECGKPVSVGPFNRLTSAAQRAAVIARDRGCVIPDCGLPSGWCELHWCGSPHADGSIGLDDLFLLCRSHHVEAHHAACRADDGFMEPPQ